MSTDAKRWKRLSAAARRLAPSERGVTVIEFALVFPIMLIIFIGMVEFGEAFSVSRKISNAASTVSDLVSQETAVTNARLANIATIADELIRPYGGAPFSLRIISVVADDKNEKVSVAWSYPEGAAAVGSEYKALPSAAMTEANSSLIVAETSYAFTPTVGHFIGSVTLNGIAYFRPRMVQSVSKAD